MIFAVVIVCLESSINDWQKEQQFQELNKAAEQKKIVRDSDCGTGELLLEGPTED